MGSCCNWLLFVICRVLSAINAMFWDWAVCGGCTQDIWWLYRYDAQFNFYIKRCPAMLYELLLTSWRRQWAQMERTRVKKHVHLFVSPKKLKPLGSWLWVRHLSLLLRNENIEKRVEDPAEMSISRHCSVTQSHFSSNIGILLSTCG